MGGWQILSVLVYLWLCSAKTQQEPGQNEEVVSEVVTRGQIRPRSPVHFTAATQEMGTQRCSAQEESGGDG